MERNTATIYLRTPPELKLALLVAAKENGRTLNAEVVQRLLVSLHGYRR